MQRIPNPVSDVDVFIRVFQEIHQILGNSREFNLDDISRAMIEKNNVTSQGAIGAEALRRSTRSDRSRDPIYNQSKMYAELFRTLGWIQSTTSKLKYEFSFIGNHIARSKSPNSLVVECLIGIAYPNEVLGVTSNQTIRIFGGILKTMSALGGITRDEMIAGPLSIKDDTSQTEFQKMVERLRACRKKPGELDKWIDELSYRDQISRHPTMENYTRIPVAAVQWAKWGEKRGRSLIEISGFGKSYAEQVGSYIDFRAKDFDKLANEIRAPFLYYTLFSMLERSGYDLSPVAAKFETAMATLYEALPEYREKQILFSPFQQLSRETLLRYIPDVLTSEDAPEASHSRNTSPIGASQRPVFEPTHLSVGHEKEHKMVLRKDPQIIEELKECIRRHRSTEAAIDELHEKYESANRDIYYGYIVKLFQIIGYDCRLSRGGQNYERADAILFIGGKAVPIEIKSPGEEKELSVKGIRQALENKIILLARNTYPTDRNITSLVVGYNTPNTRSEVHELIEDIFTAYEIKIGVIGFKALLAFALSAVVDERVSGIKDLENLKGVSHA